ncbi:mechanosensitive ion channel family protein [Ancylomarina euxinus]|uniref:Mechanosensitive ion channel family protein n=1 Tax=Ancylomarina euxinus TaxID=2283627 RepID=A0A425Y084_9BACT|nr:mechanosensitive ion channel domain-containing protein [Ancylomarina euxinus]MCZ4695241.1 mechanosensitive ion channel [Ancylomarina euxinus]MUP15438.1 mechanosensitive ion channel [Ancylomarina euxinus]RRG21148.1 mechanosensitive ion channel family protein [Ancylomarina euxinus]
MKHFTFFLLCLLIGYLYPQTATAQDTILFKSLTNWNDTSVNALNLERIKSEPLIKIKTPAIKKDSSTSTPDTIERVQDKVAKDKINSHEQDTNLFSAKNLFSSFEQKVPNKPKDVLEVISLSKIFWTLILIIVGYYFIQLVIKILYIFSERSARFRITIKGIIPVFRILTWAIIIFAIIKGIYDPPFETVIAFTASVGIAIGLAAQDLLKNVFGGMALLLDRPFMVGDKIDSGKYYGEVIEIGLRATRLVTADDSVVSVPNAELVNSSVSNSNSGELNCQVVAEIYLPIDIDTFKVRQIATESAQVSRYVYLNKPITVLFFNEVKERRSYLKMRIKAYVMDIRYEFQFKSDMTEIVIRELLKEGLISKDELF